MEDFPEINDSPFNKIKTLELLHLLRESQAGPAAICKVEFRDPKSRVEELLESSNISDVQVLEKENDRTYLIFMKGRPKPASSAAHLIEEGGYLFYPLEVRDDKLKLTFLGSPHQVQAFLKQMQVLGLHGRVISLTDAEFAPPSPVYALTQRQREILIIAHKSGYFDVPKKIKSEQLAQKLHVARSTLVEILNTAEKHLLDEILK